MERSQTGSKTVRSLHGGGSYWRVFEHVPAYDRRKTATLIFETDGVVRRVRNFPANWADLSDDELFAVSEGI